MILGLPHSANSDPGLATMVPLNEFWGRKRPVKRERLLLIRSLSLSSLNPPISDLVIFYIPALSQHNGLLHYTGTHLYIPHLSPLAHCSCHTRMWRFCLSWGHHEYMVTWGTGKHDNPNSGIVLSDSVGCSCGPRGLPSNTHISRSSPISISRRRIQHQMGLTAAGASI
jgi:hypothetical protein